MPENKRLFICTSNKHKVREIREILKPVGVELVQKKLPISEPDFESIEEVAIHKAKEAYAKVGKPLIAEDTGIYFGAYKNFPGHLAKRVWVSIGFDGLFRLLKGKKRTASFKVVICFIWGKNKFKLFSGELHGKILSRAVKPKADRLPYEKIFVPNGHKKAVVEMGLREKNEISHRAVAAKKLAKWLERGRKMALTQRRRVNSRARKAVAASLRHADKKRDSKILAPSKNFYAIAASDAAKKLGLTKSQKIALYKLMRAGENMEKILPLKEVFKILGSEKGAVFYATFIQGIKEINLVLKRETKKALNQTKRKITGHNARN
ncbi:MAG: non-canonical purine NTP pyrophosphatase [Candidatus Diapherotrites archaeon]